MSRKGVSSLWFVVLCLLLAARCGAESIATNKDSVGDAANSEAASHEGPSAVFVETVHDFGKVSPDGRYEHDFRVSNIGTEDLVIRKVVVG